MPHPGNNRDWLGTVTAMLLLVVFSTANADHPPEGALHTDHVHGSTLINAAELIALAESHADLHIIDARLPTDRRYGYIEGSINLPDVKTNCGSLATVLPDKQTPAAFYCNGPRCGRSAKAVAIAVECGYRDVYWFRGGLEAWLSENYPVNRD